MPRCSSKNQSLAGYTIWQWILQLISKSKFNYSNNYFVHLHIAINKEREIPESCLLQPKRQKVARNQGYFIQKLKA